MHNGRVDGVVQQGIKGQRLRPHPVEHGIRVHRVQQRGQHGVQGGLQRHRDLFDHQATGRRDMDRQPVGIELGQHTSETGHGATTHGPRTVSSRPAHGGIDAARLFLGDHDRVEAPPAQVEGESAELTQRIADAREQIGVFSFLDDPPFIQYNDPARIANRAHAM